MSPDVEGIVQGQLEALSELICALRDDLATAREELQAERSNRLFLARNIATAARLAERCFQCESDVEKLLACGNLAVYVQQLEAHTRSLRLVKQREDVADVARDVLLAGVGR